MKHPEFMWLKADLIPEEIKEKYSLCGKIIDGWVYVCIEKGMYGLPQAGLLANKLLTTQLEVEG
jgi:hypothetical protein